MKSLEEEVTKQLCAAGYRASYEYPGYVRVTCALPNDEGTLTYDFGTANGVWGWDGYMADGELYDGAGGVISDTCTDIKLIVWAIMRLVGQP